MTDTPEDIARLKSTPGIGEAAIDLLIEFFDEPEGAPPTGHWVKRAFELIENARVVPRGSPAP